MNFKKILTKLFSILLLFCGLWYLFYGNPFIVTEKKYINISEKGNIVKVPDINLLKSMVINTLNLFNEGVKNKNMNKLYIKSSKEIKSQFSKKEFDEGFKTFINSNKIYDNISKQTIIFSRDPFLEPNTNVLFLKGELIEEFVFEIQYVYQDFEWKLFSLYIFPHTKYKSLGVKNDLKLNIPDNEYIRKITINSLNKFNKGLKSKTFNSLYSTLSSSFKKQISLQNINNSFKIFLSKDIVFDDKSIKKFFYTQNPFLDDYNFLVVYGYFEDSRGKVNFRLKYIYENKKWALLNIKISPLFDILKGN